MFKGLCIGALTLWASVASAAVSLHWDDPVNPSARVAGYRIEVSTDNQQTWTLVGETTPSARSLPLVLSLPGEHCYRAQTLAVPPNISSPFSPSVCAWFLMAPSQVVIVP